MKVGAQLFTVRDYCKDLSAFSETLKKIADIGYTTVQVSGTCEYEAHWLKEQLDQNGLRCVITHTAPQKLQEQLSKVCADHKTFHCNCVGLGMYSMMTGDPAAEYAKFLEIYKPVAKELKNNGLYFMYHNHDQEFFKLNGKTILQHMAEDFSPDEMGFTLDTFWVQAGGANPAQCLRDLKGRVPCIHLKDFAYGRGDGFRVNMAPVGEGNINFEDVIKAAGDAGTEYLLVEQDDCHGEDPFDCLKRSYDNLRALGLD
jgi:sugar phosphate isomerase/epimerase